MGKKSKWRNKKSSTEGFTPGGSPSVSSPSPGISSPGTTPSAIGGFPSISSPSTGISIPSTPSAAPGSIAAPTSVSAEISGLNEQIEDELNKSQKNPYQKFESPTNVASNIGGEIDGILSGIENLTKSNNFYKSLESAINLQNPESNLYGKTQLNYLKLGKLTNSVKVIFQQLSSMISYFLNLLISYLILIKKSIEIFILNFNIYLNKVLTQLANGLTQGTATKEEITVFQEQTQKFLILILVWMFVYNWYYVCFFLKESDNIRYTFDANYILNYSTILYGAFGPGVRALENFNWMIIKSAEGIQKYISNNFIYVLMFFIFLVLVSANIQSVLIIDFFNALHHQYGTSLISVMSIAMVLYYGVRYFFYESGLMRLLWQFPWFFGIPLFFIALFFYTVWIVSVNIPMAITLIFTYLVVYSFMGVLFYQGTNTLNTFTGISNNIADTAPDPDWNDICMNSPSFQFKLIPKYLWYYSNKIANWGTAYMFEILIILLLLGGIGIYLNGFQSSIASKFSASSFSGSSLRTAFTYLFTWLLIINVLIIVLLIIFMIQKYKYVENEIIPISTSEKVNIDVPEPVGAFEGDAYLTIPKIIPVEGLEDD